MSEYVAEHIDNLANDIRRHLDNSGALAEVLLVGPTMARIVADAERRGYEKAVDDSKAIDAVALRSAEERGAAKVATAVEALAQWYDEQPNWREWGVGNSIRAALAEISEE